MMELCTRFATSDTTASKAFKKLLTHLEYRAKNKTNGLALLPASQVFGNAAAQQCYNRMMPHGLLGKDFNGCPLLYKHCGKLSVSELARNGADMATTLRYNEWVTERILHAMGHRGQWSIIIDLKGLGISQVASMKWMLWIQAMASHDALHYPDRLNRVRTTHLRLLSVHLHLLCHHLTSSPPFSFVPSFSPSPLCSCSSSTSPHSLPLLGRFSRDGLQKKWLNASTFSPVRNRGSLA